MCHFYIITDSNIIKSLAAIERENHGFSSLGDGIEWSDLKTLCEKIDVPFNNQSLGQLLTVLLKKFYQIERTKFTKTEKEQIKQDQNNTCIRCNEELKKYHIDHIKPLSNGGTNERCNLQALCVSCHIEKTREEKEACEHIQLSNIKTTTFPLRGNGFYSLP
jgi:hypothetical protein